MANRSVIVSFITKLNNRGIKNATKDLKGFEKISTGIGARAKLGFGIAAVAAVAFAEKITRISIKAVIAEEKQVASLSSTLKNLGKASEIPGILKFAEDLQRTSGISEDVLRPNLQSLISTLGDTGAAQTLLSRAIDISVGSGKDLGTVTNALNKGFSGNLAALNKLVPGLDQTKIASNDLAGIMDDLALKFGGQGAAAAATMQGSLDKLKNSAAESAETLGKGIGDALAILGVDGVSKTNALGKSMENLASNSSIALAGLAGYGKDLLNKFSELNGKTDGQIEKVGKLAFRYTGLGLLFGMLNKKGKEQLEIQKKITDEAKMQQDTAAKYDKGLANQAADRKAAQDQKALAAVLAAAKAKAEAIDKKKAADKKREENKKKAKKDEEDRKDKMLKTLESKFDIDTINLAIAKRRAGTEEEKAAVAGLQAIKSESVKDDETALAKLMALDKMRAAAVAADIAELNKLKINIPLYYESLGIKMPPGSPTPANIPPPSAPPPKKKESVAPVIVINQISPEGAGAVSTGGFARIPNTSVQDLIDREMAIDKPFMPGDTGFSGSGFSGMQAEKVSMMQEQVRSSPEYASLASAMSGFQSASLGSGLPAEGLMGASNLPDFSTLALGQDASGMTIVVNVAGSVSTEQDLVSAIATGLNNLQRSGVPTNLVNQGR